MKKKPALLVLVALILLAGAVYWFAIRPSPVLRTIHGIKPISADEAIFATRHYFYDSDTLWRYAVIEKVGVDGRTLWAKFLNAPPMRISNAEAAIASDPSRVFLAIDGAAGPMIIALNRDTGAELWRVVMPRGFNSFRRDPIIRVHGESLIVAQEDSGDDESAFGSTVSAISTRDGSLLWPLPGQRRYIGKYSVKIGLLGPGRLVLQDVVASEEEVAERKWPFKGVRIAVIVDSVTGAKVLEAPHVPQYCATPKGAVGFGIFGDVFLPDLNTGETEIPPLQDTNQKTPWTYSGPCGIYKNFVILFRTRLLSARSASLVAIDLVTGKQVWERRFGEEEEFDLRFSEDSVFPRMLPVVTTKGPYGEEERRLAVVDLEDGTIVSDAPLSEAVDIATTANDAVVFAREGKDFFGVDSVTGTKTSPYQADIFLGWYNNLPDISYGRLWFPHANALEPGDPGWTVIDIKTWKVLHTHDPD